MNRIAITVINSHGEPETHILHRPHTPIHCDHGVLLTDNCEDCRFETVVQEWALQSELFDVIK